MCGIAGWLGDLDSDSGLRERMAQALYHRGPDSSGIRSWPQATLIHTRLSIIDVSATGAQPIANEDGTVWAIVNGEIYNHREIRRSLKASGHRFKGHSDSEVIPHLYEEEGFLFVNQLRGMFALAIYDTRKQLLILARDWFGIKPLFYAPGNARFGFASEISSLRQLPGIDERPDAQAVSDFAALSYIPAPQTFFRGIRALQPGELILARMSGDDVLWETQTYHRWQVAPELSMTISHATEKADALIWNAVRQQIESDVPLGALLSGGIDSSLVCAAAQDATQSTLKTFNVRFSDTAYDETWAAVSASEYFGSHHKTLEMDNFRGTWDYIVGLLTHCGQPFADTSIFAVNAVCRAMRQHVTVALSGDGGDEGFGGYNLYWQIARIVSLQRVPSLLWMVTAFAMSPFAKFGIVPSTLPQRVRDFNGADDTSIVQNMFCWLGEAEHKKLCLNSELSPVRRLFKPQWEYDFPRRATRLERLSAYATEANIRLALPGDFLFKVDMASMKESLEVRVPMLDEDLFTFGLSLPHHLKVDGRTCKRVLREVSKLHLPPAVANKPKLGFGIPVDMWVDDEVKTHMRALLLGSSSRLPEFFSPSVFQPIVEAFCDGIPCPGVSRQGLYQRAIMLLSLQLALEPDVI